MEESENWLYNMGIVNLKCDFLFDKFLYFRNNNKFGITVKIRTA